MMKMSRKGFGYLLPLAIGLISLSVGIALAFLIPEVVLASLNGTGIMNTGSCYAYNTTPAQCVGTVATCCVTYQTYQNATTAINSIRALGFVVIVISVIWVLIAVISGRKGGAV
jgi:hypothetical protein